MRMTPPKFLTWLVAVILGVAGILLHFGFLDFPLLAPYIFWLVAAGFILLVLATLFKGL